jgi:sucrose-6-phosphatase
MTLQLFVTDLDYTLVGDDLALSQIDRQLREYRRAFGTKIVYATGRSRQSYQELAAAKNLLVPDALVVAVGTEIYHPAQEDKLDRGWEDRLSVGWNRAAIVEIAARISELTPQPLPEQRPFKVSYFLSPKIAPDILAKLHQECDRLGLVVDIIYSGDRDLDILPRGGNKGEAVKFLRSNWQLAADRSVVCGDSGNDISLFGVDRTLGIMVGNAQPELQQWAAANPSDRHYQATAKYAAGIIEGLAYFGFDRLGN